MTTGYSRAQIWLHWGAAAALLVAFASHEAMQAAWRAVGRGGEYTTPFLHIGAGVAVLAIALARLWLRRRRGAAAPVATAPGWMTAAAGLTHAALYVLMILLPATGAAAWFLGLREAGEIHELMFNLGLALVGLHVAAALFHHLVRRDSLLLRMWRPARVPAVEAAGQGSTH
jgi:cytochrome b561